MELKFVDFDNLKERGETLSKLFFGVSNKKKKDSLVCNTKCVSKYRGQKWRKLKHKKNRIK
jgi:hypothetical protein